MRSDTSACATDGCERPRKTRGLCDNCYQFAKRYGWLDEVTRNHKRYEQYDGPTSVYRLYAQDGALLYVGVSQDPRRRLYQHSRQKSWWPDVTRTHIDEYACRAEALDAERTAIDTEAPVFNLKRQAPA